MDLLAEQWEVFGKCEGRCGDPPCVDWNTKRRRLPDGVPCNHTGCLNHITHPCEGCSRIAGRYQTLEQQQ